MQNIFTNNWQRYLQWLSKTEVCFWVLKLQHVLSYLTGATLDVVTDKFDFYFQRLGSY